jgi:hypothetical protein
MVRDEGRNLNADAGFNRELAEILVGIKRAIKIFLAYPENHPARAQALERTHKQITQLLAQRDSLSLDISGEGFSCAEARVGGDHPLLQGFSLEFTLRGIQTIRFLSGIRLADLQHLTELLITGATDLSKHGGGRAFLQGRGTNTIEIESLDVRFVEAISPLQDSAPQQGSPVAEPLLQPASSAPPEATSPEEAHTPRAEAAGEGGGPTAPPEEVAGAEGAEEAKDEVPADLEALIRELQQTDRPARYEYLTEELSRRGREELARGEVDTCLRVMTALALELHPTNPKAETVTRYARWSLRTMVEETGPQPLIEGFCRGGTASHDDLVHLLLTLKEEMAQPVVDQLLIEREIGARQKLADLLIKMGPASLPALRSALTAPSWETARRLFLLLPRLPTADVTDMLKRLVKHHDPRIRREGIRLLGQMDAALTGEPLLDALRDVETSVRQAAMAALGGLKVKAAVPSLRQIAQEAPGARALEEQKMAIAALGAIGDPEALPTLVALLHRKGWLSRRRTEELRIAAAYALGALGRPEATQALRAAARSAPTALRQACEAALRDGPRSDETKGTR